MRNQAQNDYLHPPAHSAVHGLCQRAGLDSAPHSGRHRRWVLDEAYVNLHWDELSLIKAKRVRPRKHTSLSSSPLFAHPQRFSALFGLCSTD